MGMQFVQEKESPEENHESHLKALNEVESLEKEEGSLIREKEELIDVEQQLWNRISVTIQNKRQRNKELREEIEQLRSTCEKLSGTLNSINLNEPCEKV
jgi:chromosome segregation ATPase